MDGLRNRWLPFAVAAVAGFGSVGLATFLTRDVWGYPLLPWVTCLYPALFLALVGGILLLVARIARGAALRRIAVVFFWPAAFAAGMLPWFPLNAFVSWYDLRKAKEFCLYLAPEIERYKVEHGRYPDEISWLLKKQYDLPKLADKGIQYHIVGSSFRLDVVAPDRPFAWYSYDPQSGRWNVIDD